MNRFSRVWRAVPVIALVFVTLPALAQVEAELERIDALLEEEAWMEAQQALNALEGQVQSGAQRAEVYWRLAQATLQEGDGREDDGLTGDPLLAIFTTGEQWAQRAIDADPTNHLGYYWASANIGRWGQTKGVLDSLFRAPEMRDMLRQAVTMEPEHADSYYVLGRLYNQVPGVISFGNIEYAVSFGRLSVELMEAEVAAGEREEASESFYIQLASHLIKRNWNERKRSREMAGLAAAYRGASTPFARGQFYEGSAAVPRGDDASEARALLQASIRRLEARRDPTPGDLRNLEEARELLASI